ncbi:MAG: DUF11 domain-containing protein [Candidatus Peribacteria bacterium]|jgi:uncharacterized repeat protein (TIGR01451 family)|nr:DUF11 domain-containing protein [Candidatus Peribacteria bacterium]
MTLPPHSSGYLILTGKVLDTHTDSTLNKACIFHTTKTECSQVLYTTTQPSLKIEKRVDNSEVKVGDIVTFTLTITNTSKLPISGFTITDTLPANNVISYINQSSDGFTFSKTNNQLIWGNYTKTLQPNSSISVDFKAKVETTGIHTNFACITHIDFPQW